MPSSSRAIRPVLHVSHLRQSTTCARQFSCIPHQAQISTTANKSRPSCKFTVSSQPALSRDTRSISLRQQRYASSSAELKHTPLYKVHTDSGAKMGPFAGFSMPLEYPDQSHPESHIWTRENASLFDVSHMVQHKLSGPLAEEFLMTVTPSSFDKLAKHHSQLSCLLDENGGIVDDTVITRIGRDSFYFVTNAGCRDTDLPFLRNSMKSFLESKSAKEDQITWHVLDHHALVALQGPKAKDVLESMIYIDAEEEGSKEEADLSSMPFGSTRWLRLHLKEEDICTPSLLVSRTGYTGEDGFEISIPPENGDSTNLATSIANAFLSDKTTVRWAGLAARDSLRLEAGMCLYGHDINTTTTPPVAGLTWIVGKDRRSENSTPKFNGQSTILAQIAEPKSMKTRRVGFLVEKGPAAREGAEIVDLSSNDHEVIGKITSGCPAPSLGGQNIAMGLIKNGYHKKGTKVGVKVRKGVRQAEVAKMPFVDNKFYRPDLKGKA